MTDGDPGGRWRSRPRLEEGATAIEYAVLVAFVAAVIVLAVIVLGQALPAGFETVRDALD